MEAESAFFIFFFYFLFRAEGPKCPPGGQNPKVRTIMSGHRQARSSQSNVLLKKSLGKGSEVKQPTLSSSKALENIPGRNYIRPPPPFWLKGIFQGRGVGVVYFEAPRGRNFIPPPLLYTPHP